MHSIRTPLFFITFLFGSRSARTSTHHSARTNQSLSTALLFGHSNQLALLLLGHVHASPFRTRVIKPLITQKSHALSRDARHTKRTRIFPLMEVGFQVDYQASAASLSILVAFALLQLKVRDAQAMREERDAAVESLRTAETKFLGGELRTSDVENAKLALRAALTKHRESRSLFSALGIDLRVPDPTKEKIQAFLRTREEFDDFVEVVRPTSANETDVSSSSPLPSGSDSATVKDAAIFFTFILQIAWFLLSLTDPVGTVVPAGLDQLNF